MLSPTAWWIAVEPIDLRRGMDGLLATIARQFGHDGSAGGAYVFRVRTGSGQLPASLKPHEVLPGPVYTAEKRVVRA